MGECVGCYQGGTKCALAGHDLLAMTSTERASGIVVSRAGLCAENRIEYDCASTSG
jgi:hypothetical protein